MTRKTIKNRGDVSISRVHRVSTPFGRPTGAKVLSPCFGEKPSRVRVLTRFYGSKFKVVVYDAVGGSVFPLGYDNGDVDRELVNFYCSIFRRRFFADRFLFARLDRFGDWSSSSTTVVIMFIEIFRESLLRCLCHSCQKPPYYSSAGDRIAIYLFARNSDYRDRTRGEGV